MEKLYCWIDSKDIVRNKMTIPKVFWEEGAAWYRKDWDKNFLKHIEKTEIYADKVVSKPLTMKRGFFERLFGKKD